MVEHWIADLKLIDSSFIRCNVFMKNFQEFLMTVQEKCGKFECGQNQRRQLLERFFKVEWSLIPVHFSLLGLCISYSSQFVYIPKLKLYESLFVKKINCEYPLHRHAFPISNVLNHVQSLAALSHLHCNSC